jgi:hypothetical protein
MSTTDDFETDYECESNDEPDTLTKAVYLCGPQIYQFCEKIGIMADLIPSEIIDTLEEMPADMPIATIDIRSTPGDAAAGAAGTTYKISLGVGDVLHTPFDVESEPAKNKIYDAIYMLIDNIMIVYPKIAQRYPIFEKKTLTLFNHYNDYDRLVVNITKL